MNRESASSTHIFSYQNESIADLPGYLSRDNIHSRLVNFSYNDKPSILPSDNYIQFMSEALYLHAANTGILPVASGGDLRGYIPLINNNNIGDAYNYVDVKGNQECLIYKYFSSSDDVGGINDPDNGLIINGLFINRYIPTYRIPHLYLRFAEALNRLGKPTLAFAVIKYGLTDAHVRDTLTVKVNPNELGESFTQFPRATFFDNNASMAGRGRGGGIPIDTAYFVIPVLPTKQDSILWVEDRILDEMAAETPFEGNRFFDLLRVSRRRANHPEFMADKVAAKYQNKDAMKVKLLNPDIWFLP
jgi:hypothetical protein